MISMQTLRTSLAAALLAAGMMQPAFAQNADKPFEPSVGQQGKDVVWVPTSQALVNKMLDMAKLAAGEIHYDLGSGDGRTVITAAKRGARAYGIEYNPDMVELSKRNAAKEGVSDRATFAKADLFETDFSQANVVTLFLLPDINLKLRPKILNMKPGTRIVSNTFTMGEWQADETAQAGDEGSSYYRTALLWIVPAKVEGTWKMGQGELALKQEFQMLSGTLKNGDRVTPISNARMRGDQISFTAAGAEYTGKVAGGRMEGSVKTGGSTAQWSAAR